MFSLVSSETERRMLKLGLFKNYESSGPGIPKYAPKKKGLALFWDIFFRKFWLLTGLNLLFFIFCLPLYIGFLAMSFMKNYDLLLVILGILFLIFSVFIGPAMAGMTRVIRSLVIQKHTFVIRDFFKAFKENFKQSCIIGVLDIIAVLSAFSSYNIYPALAFDKDNKLFYVPMVISLAIFLVIFMMNYYIFLMMTATTLSLKNLIKNSFALAVASLKQNIISTVVIIMTGIFMLTIFLYTPPLFLIVIPAFPMALVWFTVCFTCYPQIQKYVINPYYDSIGQINPELTDDAELVEEETLFEDMGGKEKPIEKHKKGKGRRIS